MRGGAGRIAMLVAAVLSGVSAAPGAAQAAAQVAGGDEIRLLQQAAQREAAGEMDAAERVLREVLEGRGGSVPALLSLERVLRIQGRLEELPPLVETALADDPRSALLNQLLVRSYSELDRVDELERAGARWIAEVPRIEIPYRQVAEVWLARGEYGRAREILEAGRRRIEAPDALALELGDLFAALGEPGLAVAEWDRAIDPGGRGLNQVRRRLRALPDSGRSVVPELVDRLAADATAAGRMDAALQIAVEAGLQERARAVAEAHLPMLGPGDRRHLLDGVARRADAEGHRRLAYWAYDQLLDLEWVREGDEGRFLALRNRLAELALELGDTTAAATGYRAVEEAYAPGSPQRRQAGAARIELLAAQDPEEARRALATFQTEFPESPEERDHLTALVARELMTAGREDDAAALLAEAAGPRSSILRGRLLLVRGDVAAARLAFLSAATSLRGVEATSVLSLVTLLGRVSVDAGSLIGEALMLRDRGHPGDAVDRVASALDALSPADRPPVLDFVAGIADEAGLGADARTIRRRLIAEHPRSAEAPGALLALARGLEGEAGSEEEARELLERLIIEYPRSALVPQARRALDQLSGRGVG